MERLRRIMAAVGRFFVPFAGVFLICVIAGLPGLALSAYVPCVGADLGYFQMMVHAPIPAILWMVAATPLGSIRNLAGPLGLLFYVALLITKVDRIPVSDTCCKQLFFPLEGQDCSNGVCYPYDDGYGGECE